MDSYIRTLNRATVEALILSFDNIVCTPVPDFLVATDNLYICITVQFVQGYVIAYRHQIY